MTCLVPRRVEGLQAEDLLFDRFIREERLVLEQRKLQLRAQTIRTYAHVSGFLRGGDGGGQVSATYVGWCCACHKREVLGGGVGVDLGLKVLDVGHTLFWDWSTTSGDQ
jgi:hypothetical protein